MSYRDEIATMPRGTFFTTREFADAFRLPTRTAFHHLSSGYAAHLVERKLLAAEDRTPTWLWIRP